MKKSMAMNKADGQAITAANAAVVLIKLLQIVCGVVRDNDSGLYHFENNERLKLLEECVEESGRKAIVFIPFIGVMDKIREYLVSKGYMCGVVNGEISGAARQVIFDEFQHGKLEVLLAHPKTTAHGLTLTAASTIIWYSPIFSVEQFTQANARIHRPGQKNHCTIVQLGATPMEWDLYLGLKDKIELQKAILRQYEEALS
jgi:SNF2 family DNA or RNA helicase